MIFDKHRLSWRDVNYGVGFQVAVTSRPILDKGGTGLQLDHVLSWRAMAYYALQS